MPKRKAYEISGSDAAPVQSQEASLLHPSNSDTTVITEANKLDVQTFHKRFIQPALLQHPLSESNSAFEITLQSAESLVAEELGACFNLVETTSRNHYEGAKSFGWHPRRKKCEMLEEDMRYLLIRRRVTRDKDVEGFLSFMLTLDSTPCVPVLYVYEVHLSEALRGLGLGKHMLKVAEAIAQSVGVEKVMLTCILTNEKAHEFYKRQGFKRDASSPEDKLLRRKIKKADYVVMSRTLRQSPDSNNGRSEKKQKLSRELVSLQADDSTRSRGTQPWSAAKTPTENEIEI